MLSMIKIALMRFRQDDKGATAIEYGLIAALIAVAIVAGVTLLGNSLNDLFVSISGELGT